MPIYRSLPLKELASSVKCIFVGLTEPLDNVSPDNYIFDSIFTFECK